MQIQSISDISLFALRESASVLPADWHVDVDEAQMFFKAMEPPSWISIVAQAPWWLQALAASASVYISGIISEAGKDTWKNRGKIAAVVRRVPSAITQLAEFVASAKSAGSTETFAILAIPFPDEHNTAQLRLSYSTREELEFSVALFVHHIPALEQLWNQERLQEKCPVGGIQLEFGNDCSLLVTWMDRASLSKHERVLPFGVNL
jgi:hypothetical protein